MKRVAIVVEGDTEEEFVKQVLQPHLGAHGVVAVAMKPNSRGGNISVERLAPAMAKLSWNFDAVTSLVDFYEFKRKQPNETVEDLEARIDAAIPQHRPQQSHPMIQFAYVQRHEFEALLFADPAGFGVVPDLPHEAAQGLVQVGQQFATPEDINDHRDTAPSKRIQSFIPGYHKRLHGPLVASTIGLEVIRARCPRFHAWVTRLESF